MKLKLRRHGRQSCLVQQISWPQIWFCTVFVGGEQTKPQPSRAFKHTLNFKHMINLNYFNRIIHTLELNALLDWALMHGTWSISAGAPELQRGCESGGWGTCMCFWDLIQHPGEIKERCLLTSVGNCSCFPVLRWVLLRDLGGVSKSLCIDCKMYWWKAIWFFRNRLIRNRLIDQKSLFSICIFSRQKIFFSKSSSLHCLVPDAFQ